MRLYENEQQMIKNLAERECEQRHDHDARWFIARYEEERAARDKAMSTLVPKAKFYRRAIDVSMLVTCASAMVMLILTLVSVSSHREFDPQELIVTLACVMMASLFTFVVMVIKKRVWKRKLKKLGLFVPIEYD